MLSSHLPNRPYTNNKTIQNQSQRKYERLFKYQTGTKHGNKIHRFQVIEICRLQGGVISDLRHLVAAHPLRCPGISWHCGLCGLYGRGLPVPFEVLKMLHRDCIFKNNIEELNARLVDFVVQNVDAWQFLLAFSQRSSRHHANLIQELKNLSNFLPVCLL